MKFDNFSAKCAVAVCGVLWLVCEAQCAAPIAAPISFADDAQRTVKVPKKVSRTFAAGAPAEVLLYTFAPETMVGRNHMPSQAALEFTPVELRNPVTISKLPRAQDDSNDKELISLKPDLYVDYGDLHEDYINAVNRVQERTGIPSIILDGALNSIPNTYLRLGTLLDMDGRGKMLAKEVEHILAKYRGTLLKSGSPPRVYIACSFDAAIPCLSGERNGEVAEFIGATNVAGSVETSPKRPVTIAEIRSWNPDVIIAASEEAVANIEHDAEWQGIAAVKNHHVYAAPTLPFGWGSRPPSVNRLPGMIWLAYVLSGRDFDANFYGEVRSFFKNFYHVTPTDEQLSRLVKPTAASK